MNYAFKVPQRVTTDEFLAMPEHPRGFKQELIDGEVVTMSPANAIHGQLQAAIAFQLLVHLERNGDTANVLSEVGVAPRLGAGSNVRVPDISVTREPIVGQQRLLDEPLILIEVLSLHNERQTRANVPSYASIPSVQEIVLFSSTRIEAELLIRQTDGHWPKRPLILKKGDVLSLPSIVFESPVEAFYSRTTIKE